MLYRPPSRSRITYISIADSFFVNPLSHTFVMYPLFEDGLLSYIYLVNTACLTNKRPSLKRSAMLALMCSSIQTERTRDEAFHQSH